MPGPTAPARRSDVGRVSRDVGHLEGFRSRSNVDHRMSPLVFTDATACAHARQGCGRPTARVLGRRRPSRPRPGGLAGAHLGCVAAPRQERRQRRWYATSGRRPVSRRSPIARPPRAPAALLVLERLGQRRRRSSRATMPLARSAPATARRPARGPAGGARRAARAKAPSSSSPTSSSRSSSSRTSSAPRTPPRRSRCSSSRRLRGRTASSRARVRGSRLRLLRCLGHATRDAGGRRSSPSPRAPPSAHVLAAFDRLRRRLVVVTTRSGTISIGVSSPSAPNAGQADGLAHLPFDLVADVGVLDQELPRVLATLPELVALVGEPGAATS